MRGPTLIPALAFLACAPAAALSADWAALVVARAHPASDSSLDDAALAWQALDVSGIPVARTVLNGTVAAITAAAADLAGTPGAVIYFSGPGSPDGLAMADGTVGIDTLVSAVARAGVARLVLMIENCPANGAAAPFEAVLPPAPDGLAAVMFTSADAATPCTSTDRLTDRLDGIARTGPQRDDLRDVLAGLPGRGAVTDRIDITPRTIEGQDSAAIEFLPDDVILLDAVDDGEAAAPVQVVLPVVTLDDDTTVSDPSEPLVTLAVLPAEQIVALPLIAGQPEPSIIVGTIDGITDAAFRPDAAQQDDSRALTFDDIAARRALKASNPDLFELLLTAGSFDPPDSQLAIALQTELQRMNCYTLRVDGDWGNGSRRAFQAYLDRLGGVQVASLDASVDLFRLILRNDDVACPVAAAAPAAPAATTRTAAPTRTAPAATPPAAAQPAPTAPASEPSTGGFPGNFGGVFR